MVGFGFLYGCSTVDFDRPDFGRPVSFLPKNGTWREFGLVYLVWLCQNPLFYHYHDPMILLTYARIGAVHGQFKNLFVASLLWPLSTREVVQIFNVQFQLVNRIGKKRPPGFVMFIILIPMHNAEGVKNKAIVCGVVFIWAKLLINSSRFWRRKTLTCRRYRDTTRNTAIHQIVIPCKRHYASTTLIGHHRKWSTTPRGTAAHTPFVLCSCSR